MTRGERRYKVLWADTLDEIRDLVQTHMDQGWDPQGGICVVNLWPNEPHLQFQYYQAVICTNPAITDRLTPKKETR